MIIDVVRGDVFVHRYQHIVFGINTEGYNDAGFAGRVSSRYWPELANTGELPLGRVLLHAGGDRIFHAIVCHSLRGKNAWAKAPGVIETALRGLLVSDDDPVAAVLMGAGPIGQAQGADTILILGAMARSKKNIVVFTR